MLYGMADAEKQALVDLGHRLRIYMPVRRVDSRHGVSRAPAAGKHANDSFLRAGFVEHVSPEKLLENPMHHAADLAKSDGHPMNVRVPIASQLSTMPSTFTNQPPIDYAIPENREGMQAALRLVREQFGRHYPLVIGGGDCDTAVRGESTNPANKSEVIGTYALAPVETVDRAVVAAKAAP